MPDQHVKCAVIGASGYAGEELVRLLLQHPGSELVAVTSRQHCGKSLSDVFPRFAGQARSDALHFSDFDGAVISGVAELVFLALPHGVSAGLAKPLLESDLRLIDLSADFRLRSPEVYREFYDSQHPAPELLGSAVYGLPERYRNEIADARLVAAPGCYPTSILLPLIPLLRAGLIRTNGIMVSSLSGVTGAGRKVDVDYLFGECNESARPYGIPKHRHLSEIEQELAAAIGEPVTVQFVPHLVPMNRGIISTMFLQADRTIADADLEAVYGEAYRDEPFIRLLGSHRLPDTKNVVGTNFVDIGWKMDTRTGRVIVSSAIDNLIKGTSGQAVQCLNLMCGYPETAGLL